MDLSFKITGDVTIFVFLYILYNRVSKTQRNNKAVLEPRVSPAFAITFLAILYQKVNDPKMTFDPTSVEVTCVTLPKDYCVQVPWEYINVC